MDIARVMTSRCAGRKIGRKVQPRVTLGVAGAMGAGMGEWLLTAVTVWCAGVGIGMVVVAFGLRMLGSGILAVFILPPVAVWAVTVIALRREKPEKCWYQAGVNSRK